ncbi:MAG TPA: response regulator [Spongiibacteraceae bacterium]|nr:response regulator [Spongiibacteraceae bacterium]
MTGRRMPHALIVDDSKTARYALRNLLDKHQYTADMLESAEQALDYLRERLPDLIFMDQIMPGMDGFQAVKAIKSSQNTAGIPIVMYTSTQGKVYFGHARALGAADVMTKPASAEELAAVLQRLEEQHLLGSAKAEAKPKPEPAPQRNSVAEQFEPEPVAEPLPPPVIAAPATHQAKARQPARASSWAPWIVAGWVLGIAGVALLYFSTEERRHQLAAQQQRAFKTIEWAFNLNQQFGYGEIPFGGQRLERLQELVQQLRDAGFHGTLRLESHIGEFCLFRLPATDDKAVLWVQAPAEAHITDCNALGQSTEQSQQLAAMQSPSFKRFLKELPAGIRVQTVPLGAAEPLENYPTNPEVLAADWNAVAQRNQRLHIVLQPDNL